MNETVEILLASYNGERFLREQIDSIIAQSDEGWHLTVSDDGSTDNTVMILDEYVRLYPQKIQRVESGRKFGNAKSHFLWMIGQCEADYILTCDQDDFWYSDKIAKMRKAMQELAEGTKADTPLLVFSDLTPADEHLSPICDSLMSIQKQYTQEIKWQALIFQNIVTGAACMFNHALAQLAIISTDTDQIIMHDWWLAIVAARFGRIAYLNESTGFYRQHRDNCVGAQNVSSLSHIVGKLRHLQQLKSTIQDKKAQASQFGNTFMHRLDSNDLAFIHQYAKNKSGLIFYLQNRHYIHGIFRLLGAIVLG